MVKYKGSVMSLKRSNFFSSNLNDTCNAAGLVCVNIVDLFQGQGPVKFMGVLLLRMVHVCSLTEAKAKEKKKLFPKINDFFVRSFRF